MNKSFSVQSARRLLRVRLSGEGDFRSIAEMIIVNTPSIFFNTSLFQKRMTR